MSNTSEKCRKIKENIRSAVICEDILVDKILTCLLCGGHILLEDMPGTGKTTLAKALANSVSGTFRRVQFTPDLLPSEITGISIFNPKENDFFFREGAVFTNILLADEINRATPRTQSSLLECMEEKQVSESGNTYRLPAPFLVIATQNPVENMGTFPLPEAQLDRFFMQLSLGYPSHEDQLLMIRRSEKLNPSDSVTAVVSGEEICTAQEEVKNVTVSDAVAEYIISICEETRNSSDIKLGASPRAVLALFSASRAYAAVQGRSFVLPDDVKAVAADVLAHRLLIRSSVINMSQTKRKAVDSVISRVPVPSETV